MASLSLLNIAGTDATLGVPQTLDRHTLEPCPTRTLPVGLSSLWYPSPSEAANENAEACANNCNLEGFNINVYYWPEPQANTSRLNIIGNNTNQPLQGCTADRHEIYWGCTAQNLAASHTRITTALLMTIASSFIMISLYNPCSSKPCSPDSLISEPSSTAPIETRGSNPSINARGHSLVIPSTISRNSSHPRTTVVSDNFML